MARVVFVLLLAAAELSGEAGAPDLRLEWKDRGDAISGRAGSSVALSFLVRNVGSAPAFATVLRIHTSLGRLGEAVRIQPGPSRGASIERTVTVPLAAGMRELCVEAVLQSRAPDDPVDPNPNDNRICRAIRVTERPKESQ